MDEKLLFEVDLAEADSPATAISKSLQLISRQAIQDGTLETWGEQVFVDKRVRSALATLAEKPPPELIEVVGKKLGKPPVAEPALQASLARILDVGQAGGPPVPTAPKGTPKGGTKPAPGGKDFTLDHHLSGKPAAMVDLFEQIDEYGRGIGPDVSRRIRKFYIGYFTGKRSFFTVEIQRQRLIVYVNLDPSKAGPWSEKAMRDVTNIGHYGMGDTEYSLREPAQLDEVKALISKAYSATG